MSIFKRWSIAILLTIFFFGFSRNTFASIRIVWDENSESDLANYRVYWGTKSKEYSTYKEIWNQNYIVFDNLVPGNQYYIAVTAIDFWGNESSFSNEVQVDLSDEENPTVVLPDRLELLDNYPNPFNPGTTISYRLPKEQQVELTIYNSIGQPVRLLEKATRVAGTHHINWDGSDDGGNKVPSGTYYYRLITPETMMTKKMTLLH